LIKTLVCALASCDSIPDLICLRGRILCDDLHVSWEVPSNRTRTRNISMDGNRQNYKSLRLSPPVNRKNDFKSTDAGQVAPSPCVGVVSNTLGPDRRHAACCIMCEFQKRYVRVHDGGPRIRCTNRSVDIVTFCSSLAHGCNPRSTLTF